MRIHKAFVKNFRLLADVALAFEDRSTIVVGRNNSGKTSLSEVMRRFLDDKTKFQLEDFSSACYEEFYKAHDLHEAGAGQEAVRRVLPYIELQLFCRYAPDDQDLGQLAPFIVDLDPATIEAKITLRYELKSGAIAPFFAELPAAPREGENRITFFRLLRDRIPGSYELRIWAEDPNDAANRQEVPIQSLRGLIKTGFINAQRGLDDVTTRESDVLAKVLESLFTTASSQNANAADRLIAETLSTAVEEIQTEIDQNFSGQLKGLMPTLQSFGYPGLGGQEMRTETTLNVKGLLSNFTKVRYAGYGGVALPESYNGLGVRNLIFILLQLVGFYKAFRAEKNAPGMHVVFIEEPEAHLHPQMQEVFIRQIDKIAKQLSDQSDDGVAWPVQFVVSTHSSHIANAAGFECIRYFLSADDVAGAPAGTRQTKIKDLRQGMAGVGAPDRKFLHQYLTLTRCDLFFADKAILVEGLSERLLLPIIVEKWETAEPTAAKLSTQYVTIMEVGGAYAHLFFDLLNFLELRTLVITDLDSVGGGTGKACAVHQGTTTSNACLKKWFEADPSFSLSGFLTKTDGDKTQGRLRIAYQCPDNAGGPCGRTFEDAFILANAAHFNITGDNANGLETAAGDHAATLKKSAFALKYAIENTNWNAPKYIVDGIRWLAKGSNAQADPALAVVAAAAAPEVTPHA